jgi:hypothetical protein
MKKIKQGIYSQSLLVHQRSRKNSLSSERSFQNFQRITTPPKNNQVKSPQASTNNFVNQNKIVLKDIPNV